MDSNLDQSVSHLIYKHFIESNWKLNLFQEFEITMAEVDRLIAESEAYLETAQRETMDVSAVMESTSRVLTNPGPCTIDDTDDEEDKDATPPPSSGSPASEAIVAASYAGANIASHLLNDSEIEILDCTRFPIPFQDDDDDEVFFVSSERPSTVRRHFNNEVVSLLSPQQQININANFGSNPTNISVNIDIGHHSRAPPPPRRIAGPSVRETTAASTSYSYTNVGQQRKRKPSKEVGKAKKPSPEPKETETPGNGFACAVCLENLKARLKPVSTNCGHLFCLNCLEQSIRVSGKCPLCNKKQGKNTFHRIYI